MHGAFLPGAHLEPTWRIAVGQQSIQVADEKSQTSGVSSHCSRDAPQPRWQQTVSSTPPIPPWQLSSSGARGGVVERAAAGGSSRISVKSAAAAPPSADSHTTTSHSAAGGITRRFPERCLKWAFQGLERPSPEYKIGSIKVGQRESSKPSLHSPLCTYSDLKLLQSV